MYSVYTYGDCFIPDTVYSAWDQGLDNDEEEVENGD
jgi:hypothetical protein